MCELFGISSAAPLSARFSLQQFARHGSRPGQPIDGWGLVLYDGPDLRHYREPEPAGNSRWLRFIESHQPPSRLLISHIRHATAGAVALRNTHPFVRELGGRMHSFAHNGGLPGIETWRAPGDRRFLPVGDSDSETAFCVLLARLADLWTGQPPSADARYAMVAQFAADIRTLGPANFLYSDGEYLFAHGHRRHQENGRIEPPGLWHLGCRCHDAAIAIEEAGVAFDTATASHAVTLFASRPLSGAAWRPLTEGEVVMARQGEAVAA